VEKVGAGTEDRPIIDIGCGRGEWLELLKESGLVARGVDLNHVLVDENLNRGLEVIQNDAFDYLSQLQDNQLGAVTAFHLIEHLPHHVLVKLMDESLRVLKSGGVAIFETPNPQNLSVGASTFYADPTHKQPLHPDTQKFIMEYRGFTKVELMFLHPLEKHQMLPDDEAPHLAAALNSLMGCARDFAVVGYKV
jgi:O-antigen chain-terminating methyltransferase